MNNKVKRPLSAVLSIIMVATSMLAGSASAAAPAAADVTAKAAADTTAVTAAEDSSPAQEADPAAAKASAEENAAEAEAEAIAEAKNTEKNTEENTTEENTEENAEESAEFVEAVKADAASESKLPEVSGDDSEDTVTAYVKAEFDGEEDADLFALAEPNFTATGTSTLSNAVIGKEYTVTTKNRIVTSSGKAYRFKRWQYTRGGTIFTVTGSNTYTQFAPWAEYATITAVYQSEVTLTLLPDDGAENVGATFSNGKASIATVPGEELTVSYGSTSPAGITSISIGGTESIVTWATKFTFTVPEGLKDDTEVLYKTGTSGSVKIEFKYYDRALDKGTGKPAGISTKPSTLTVYAPVTDNDYTTAIANAMTEKVYSQENGAYMSAMDITNAIDEYYFWSTQAAAAAGVGAMKNLHSANAAKTYAESGLDLTYHTNCYGYAASEDETLTREQWVTYYDASNKKITDPANSTEVNKIVVWGFNTPKLYTVTYTAPTKDNYTFDDFTDGSVAAISFDMDGMPTLVRVNENKKQRTTSYRYDEVIGGDTTDAAFSDYYKEVFDLDGVNKENENVVKGVLPGNAYADEKIAVEYSSVELPAGLGAFSFDGWYMTDPVSEQPVKVSSELEYNYRVTGDIDIFPVYKASETADKSLTLIKGETERYADNGSEYVRYETLFNANDYDDLSDIKRIAFVYAYITDYDVSTETFTKRDDIYNDRISNILYTNAEAVKIIETNGSMYDKSANGTLITALMDVLGAYQINATNHIKFTDLKLDVEDPGSYTFHAAVFTYDVVTDPDKDLTDYEIFLSSGGRAGISTVLDADKVFGEESEAGYSDIIMFAVGYDTTLSNDYILSDNYVRYTASTN